jgi:hypothetical protein
VAIDFVKVPILWEKKLLKVGVEGETTDRHKVVVATSNLIIKQATCNYLGINTTWDGEVPDNVKALLVKQYGEGGVAITIIEEFTAL